MANSLRMPSWMVALIATALAGCNDPPPKLPFTGKVTLTFVRRSGDQLVFRLANQNANVVSYRGAPTDPWDTDIKCQEKDSDLWMPAPFGLVDGDSTHTDVRPGEWIEMVFVQPMAASFQGGRCISSLRVAGGTFIESNEFEP